MTRKRKTSVNTEVLYCGRWDLNPKTHFLQNSVFSAHFAHMPINTGFSAFYIGF